MSRKKDIKREGFSLKPATKEEGPPSTKTFQPRPSNVSTFRRMYDRGDLPVQMDYNKGGYNICWKVPLDKLDYKYYLPLFFDGLTETGHPYNFFASQGIDKMLEKGGPRILPVIPQLIIPIKKALNTRNHAVMCSTLRALKHLVMSGEKVGAALVPYFRQILPIFRMFYEKSGTGDVVLGHRGDDIGVLIRETLELFERHGGAGAFLQIKYMVPTYE
ncbi:hypothetical protein VZT92_019628 [Zoarces viviparus]|uniref:Parkin coregulated protein n=1 Tax=Zoarces viviparus TaxID=48416 RepID=A0AAW1EM67_ZOAVI